MQNKKIVTGPIRQLKVIRRKMRDGIKRDIRKLCTIHEKVVDAFYANGEIESYIRGIEFIDGVTLVRLKGAIVYDTVKMFQDEFASITKAKRVKNILFDFKTVKAIDTSTVAGLIELLKHIKKYHGATAIGLINLSNKTRDLFEITKTKKLFKEYASEGEALTALR